MDATIRFLLVDAQPANLVALASLVRREGLELLLAGSGAEALELLLLNDVDLALLDVQLPDTDGFELAELMRGRERSKHVPIIFATAGAHSREGLFKGYEAGAVDFLYKPFNPQIVKGKLDVFFELARQRRELANSLRLNEMFVAILGHDLRNPLGAMLMSTALLEKSTSDEGPLRTLRHMKAAGQRMSTMINQLLDLTRARLGGGEGIVGTLLPVEVSALVKQVAEELRAAHAGRTVLIQTTGDCRTSGDPDRLLQLFSNLVGNALQHGAANAPIEIQLDGRSDEIAVSVHNGGAIPPELLSTLFEPFRGRPRPVARSHGLGLGLFIARQIALAHGGGVTVSSDRSSGTTFVVTLPRVLSNTSLPRSSVVCTAAADSQQRALGE